MNTTYHFLISIPFALLFAPTYKWLAIFAFLGGFIIDADHVFWYWLRYGSWNLKKAYKFYDDQTKAGSWKPSYGIFLPFHTIEFLIAIIIGSFFFDAVLLFTAGVLFHYVLDAIWHVKYPKRVLANHSMINWLLANKDFKREK